MYRTIIRFSFSALLIALALNLCAQSAQTFQLFNKKGKKVSFDKMIKKSKDADVFFFGELHDDVICHWLELQTLKAFNNAVGVDVGMEMFERQDQGHLHDYMTGKIDINALDSTASVWPNFKTDYKPLIDYCIDNEIMVLASNAPRSYASMVYKNGFEALTPANNVRSDFIAPRPIPYDKDLPSYKAMLDMMPGHGGENLPKAQALKDATMAYFISQHRDDDLFIHFNGSYHSDDYEGILHYLNHYSPGLDMVTLTTVRQDRINKLDNDHLGTADYYLVIPTDMTRSY